MTKFRKVASMAIDIMQNKDQQDATEFILRLLDAVDEESRRGGGGSPFRDILFEEKSTKSYHCGHVKRI
jgi:hypothetical protein